MSKVDSCDDNYTEQGPSVEELKNNAAKIEALQNRELMTKGFKILKDTIEALQNRELMMEGFKILKENATITHLDRVDWLPPSLNTQDQN